MTETIDNKIEKTSKDFLFFNYNIFNEIEKYIITNDYHRYKNKYKNFISIEKVKNLTINLQEQNKRITFTKNLKTIYYEAKLHT